MRRPVLMILAMLLVGCFLQPTARAMDQPARITGKAAPDTREVSQIMQDVGPLVLDEKRQIALSITNTGEPLVVVGGSALDNVSVDTKKDSVSVVVGVSDGSAGLSPVMNVEVSRTITGNLVIQTSAADGTGVERYHVNFTPPPNNNLMTRNVSVMRTVCTCYGGATVAKRACLATECADPAECATGPQPSQAHCKDMEQGAVVQPGEGGVAVIGASREAGVEFDPH